MEPTGDFRSAGLWTRTTRQGVRQQRREARVNLWRILKMTIPSAWQYRIKGVLPHAIQEQMVFWWYSGGRSWAGSRAFAVPNNDAVGTIPPGAARGRRRLSEGCAYAYDHYSTLRSQPLWNASGVRADP